MDSVHAAKVRKNSNSSFGQHLSMLHWLQPADEVRGKVMFFYRCLSVHRDGVSVWCHFLSGCLVQCSFRRGLCPWSHVPSEGVSWRSLSRVGLPVRGGGICLGSLCRETSPQTQKNRQCASYWNAFLFVAEFTECSVSFRVNSIVHNNVKKQQLVSAKFDLNDELW